MTFKEFIYKKCPHLNYEGENPVVEFSLDNIIQLQEEFQQNCIKHGVMQGLPTDEEIRAQALLMENKFDNHTAKIIARASYESGARWVISKLSGSPTVGKAGGDASVSDGK